MKMHFKMERINEDTLEMEMNFKVDNILDDFICSCTNGIITKDHLEMEEQLGF